MNSETAIQDYLRVGVSDKGTIVELAECGVSPAAVLSYKAAGFRNVSSMAFLAVMGISPLDCSHYRSLGIRPGGPTDDNTSIVVKLFSAGVTPRVLRFYRQEFPHLDTWDILEQHINGVISVPETRRPEMS